MSLPTVAIPARGPRRAPHTAGALTAGVGPKERDTP
jgi:hypothetical protein